MSTYFLDCRTKQSFPAFWIAGSIAGLGFVVMGGFIIHSFLGANPSERDSGMLPAGIVIIILGLLLLAGVIITLRIMSNPDDMSLKVNVSTARGKKKYDANKLVRYIERGHNNVLLFNTDEGQMRVFGCTGKLIAEIYISRGEYFFTYHLTNPSVTDKQPVIVNNIYFERFPVRRNRIMNREQVVRAVETLYTTQSLSETAASLTFVDSTEETKRLIEKDAYILPSVPMVFPKKQKDIDRALEEKENREKRAMKMLSSI